MTKFQIKEEIRCAATRIDADLVFPDDPSESVRDFYLTVWLDDIECIPPEFQPEFVKGLHDEALTLNERFRERQSEPAIVLAKAAGKAKQAISSITQDKDRYLLALETVLPKVSYRLQCSPIKSTQERPRLIRKRPVRGATGTVAAFKQMNLDFGDDPGIHPLLLNENSGRYLGIWDSSISRRQATTYFRRASDIRVVGVGGAGCRILDTVAKSGLDAFSIAMNTDRASLDSLEADVHLPLGAKLTHGLGTGSNSKIGRKAAELDSEAIRSTLIGADLVVVAVGLGGGTGSGATPVIMKIAREMGILTMAIVTTPLDYESPSRFENASECLAELQGTVDSLMVVSNERGRRNRNSSVSDVSYVSDRILSDAVHGVCEIFHRPAMHHIFDARNMKSRFGPEIGRTFVSLGSASGCDRVRKALGDALHRMQFSQSNGKAKNIVVSLACDTSLTMEELQAIDYQIRDYAASNAIVIGGASIDPTLNGELRIALLAAGM